MTTVVDCEPSCRTYLNPALFERHEDSHKKLLHILMPGDTVVIGQSARPGVVQVVRNVVVGFENGCFTIDQRPDRLVLPHYLHTEPTDPYDWRLLVVFKPRQGKDGIKPSS
ncbi:hypothetical protein D2E22_1941 [Bifidobacterium castoris]|uniref:Uncharacterized protein n=2 Tax=Bifidobacterium castoris TaxID=2306972 RepID=A0A430F4D5_9BIFI|nr:hypothetical protein D2E22_1941 [Bifidobacterium castoris]